MMRSAEHVIEPRGLAQAPKTIVVASARSCAGGDEVKKAQLRRLIDSHYEFVWRSARRLGVRPADLDDVVQEVFVVAAAHLDEITHEVGYLFRACMYAASHSRRGSHRRRELEDEDELDREFAPLTLEETVETRETRQQLQEILGEMPSHLKAVFFLFEFEQFTMIEIADVLHLPLGTVASRLRRARELFLQLATDPEGTGQQGKCDETTP